MSKPEPTQLQQQLAQVFARLGELDIIIGDLEAERAQLRNAAASIRAAMQLTAAPPAPALEAVP